MYQPFQRREHIRRAQLALQQLGYALQPDGLYGPETTAAVRLFQRDSGVRITGQIDAETWQKLMQRRGALAAENQAPQGVFLPLPSFPAQRGLAVGMAQQLLGEMHRLFADIQPVAITQEYDEDTHRQLEKIRRAWHLPTSRSLDRETWDALVLLYQLLPPAAKG